MSERSGGRDSRKLSQAQLDKLQAEQERRERLDRELRINRELRRQLCFQHLHTELPKKFDPKTKDPDLDPREEAIYRVQNLCVKLALKIDLHTESDMTVGISKLVDYLRLRHARSYEFRYGDAARMLLNPVRGEDKKERLLWQQIRYDVDRLQIKDPAHYIRNFVDPEYKKRKIT